VRSIKLKGNWNSDASAEFLQPVQGFNKGQTVELWKTEPHRDLPFRFGYPDKEKHNHLMVMRPKNAK